MCVQILKKTDHDYIFVSIIWWNIMKLKINEILFSNMLKLFKSNFVRLQNRSKQLLKRKISMKLFWKKLQIQLENLKNQLNQTDSIQIKQDSLFTFIDKLLITISPTTKNLKWKQHLKLFLGQEKIFWME